MSFLQEESGNRDILSLLHNCRFKWRENVTKKGIFYT